MEKVNLICAATCSADMSICKYDGDELLMKIVVPAFAQKPDDQYQARLRLLPVIHPIQTKEQPTQSFEIPESETAAQWTPPLFDQTFNFQGNQIGNYEGIQGQFKSSPMINHLNMPRPVQPQNLSNRQPIEWFLNNRNVNVSDLNCNQETILPDCSDDSIQLITPDFRSIIDCSPLSTNHDVGGAVLHRSAEYSNATSGGNSDGSQSVISNSTISQLGVNSSNISCWSREMLADQIPSYEQIFQNNPVKSNMTNANAINTTTVNNNSIDYKVEELQEQLVYSKFLSNASVILNVSINDLVALAENNNDVNDQDSHIETSKFVMQTTETITETYYQVSNVEQPVVNETGNQVSVNFNTDMEAQTYNSLQSQTDYSFESQAYSNSASQVRVTGKKTKAPINRNDHTYAKRAGDTKSAPVNKRVKRRRLSSTKTIQSNTSAIQDNALNSYYEGGSQLRNYNTSLWNGGTFEEFITDNATTSSNQTTQGY